MSVKVTIEHGIPLPPPTPKRKKPMSGMRLALAEMKVGDSFVINKKQYAGARSAANFTKTKISKPLPVDPGFSNEHSTERIRLWKLK